MSNIEEMLDFLKTYKYLFEFPNTALLRENVLDQIPENWVEYFKANKKSFRRNPSGPMEQFFQSIDKFKLNCEKNNPASTAEDNIMFLGLGVKKKHEIEHLSRVIHEKCETSGIKTIVDLGSGLGYISQLLFQRYGYRVFGLESDQARVESSLKRQKKYFRNSAAFVLYINHFVTEETSELLKKLIPDEPFCISGLHACADLTVTAIRLFLELPNCMELIIMPCCYHKMKMEDGKFVNFPISDALIGKNVNFFNVPFMRLGCQRIFGDEDGGGARTFHLLARAVIEKYCRQENIRLVKRKRKTKSRSLDFRDFLAEFHCAPQPDNEIIVGMWEGLDDTAFLKAEVLLALQDSLQPVCESLILEDKVAYMRERGAECRLLKIADEGLSPRCYAIAASKGR